VRSLYIFTEMFLIPLFAIGVGVAVTNNNENEARERRRRAEMDEENARQERLRAEAQREAVAEIQRQHERAKQEQARIQREMEERQREYQREQERQERIRQEQVRLQEEYRRKAAEEEARRQRELREAQVREEQRQISQLNGQFEQYRQASKQELNECVNAVAGFQAQTQTTASAFNTSQSKLNSFKVFADQTVNSLKTNTIISKNVDNGQIKSDIEIKMSALDEKYKQAVNSVEEAMTELVKAATQDIDPAEPARQINAEYLRGQCRVLQ